MSFIENRDPIHPESIKTLEQLIKLHGKLRLISEITIIEARLFKEMTEEIRKRRTKE